MTRILHRYRLLDPNGVIRATATTWNDGTAQKVLEGSPAMRDLHVGPDWTVEDLGPAGIPSKVILVSTPRHSGPSPFQILATQAIEEEVQPPPFVSWTSQTIDEVDRPKIEPPIGLLRSMAMRYDHAFPLHPKATQEGILVTMRQLWEEVAGLGFYRGPGTILEALQGQGRGL